MNQYVEVMCREICKHKGIDPDGVGHAVTDATERLLGKSYPLWEYQRQFVENILAMVEGINEDEKT